MPIKTSGFILYICLSQGVTIGPRSDSSKKLTVKYLVFLIAIYVLGIVYYKSYFFKKSAFVACL